MLLIYHILFIQPSDKMSIDGHFSSFQFVATVNNDDISFHVQVFVQICIFMSLAYIPRRGMTGLNDNSIFNILRNCCFPKRLHHFTSPPLMSPSSSSSIALPTLIMVYFFILVTLVGMT